MKKEEILLTTLVFCYGCVGSAERRENYSPEYKNRPKATQLEYVIPKETIEEYLKKVPKLPLPVDKEFEDNLFKKQNSKPTEQKKEKPAVLSIKPLYAQF
ncbi:MAG: hypothetical protein AABX65_03170 [Nanoarchaeota archaeon]